MRATLVLGLAMCGCGGAEFQTALFDDAGDTGDPGDAASPPASDAPLGVSLDAPLAAPLDAPLDSSADACPAHIDGFGDSFTSCAPVYSVALAFAACVAGGGAVSCYNADTIANCPSSHDDRFVAYLENGGGCREWVYSGSLQGEAFYFSDSCRCPSESDAAVTFAWR